MCILIELYERAHRHLAIARDHLRYAQQPGASATEKRQGLRYARANTVKARIAWSAFRQHLRDGEGLIMVSQAPAADGRRTPSLILLSEPRWFPESNQWVPTRMYPLTRLVRSYAHSQSANRAARKLRDAWLA